MTDHELAAICDIAAHDGMAKVAPALLHEIGRKLAGGQSPIEIERHFVYLCALVTFSALCIAPPAT